MDGKCVDAQQLNACDFLIPSLLLRFDAVTNGMFLHVVFAIMETGSQSIQRLDTATVRTYSC